MNRLTFPALLLAITIVGFGATSTSAQDPDLADHPMVGAWLFQIPGVGPGVYIVSPDGTTMSTGPLSSAQAGDVSYSSPMAGVWEPVDEDTIHATGVGWMTDANGVLTGSITFDGNQTASEDGLTDYEEPGATITIRDAENNIVNEFPGGGAAVTGTRMSPGAPGFPEVLPASSASPSTAP